MWSALHQIGRVFDGYQVFFFSFIPFFSKEHRLHPISVFPAAETVRNTQQRNCVFNFFKWMRNKQKQKFIIIGKNIADKRQDSSLDLSKAQMAESLRFETKFCWRYSFLPTYFYRHPWSFWTFPPLNSYSNLSRFHLLLLNGVNCFKYLYLHNLL